MTNQEIDRAVHGLVKRITDQFQLGEFDAAEAYERFKLVLWWEHQRRTFQRDA